MPFQFHTIGVQISDLPNFGTFSLVIELTFIIYFFMNV